MTYKPKSDLNHHTPIDPDHRYACMDRPKPGEPWIDMDCGHTWKETDPQCSGCKWRDSGP